MNKYLFASVLAVFAVLFFVADSSACNRCGVFGRRCHFAAPVHHAPVVHAPAVAEVSNFIFNNSYPGPLLPAAGASLYGYHSPAGPQGFSLNAQGLYVDPAMVLDRAARFTELSLSQGTAATDQFKQLGSQALALNDQLNQRASTNAIAAVAISAMQSGNATAPQAAALKVSVNSAGETKAEWITPDAGIKALGGIDISLSCAKCHNKPIDSAPHGFVFDGKAMTREEFDWASEAVWSGKMPPNSKLDRAGKSQVVEKLRELVK